MKIGRLAFALSAAAFVCSAPALADVASDAAKVESLLTQAGYKYQRTSSNSVFWVPMKGDNLGDFRVILATGEELEVMFVVIAKKSEINLTPELTAKMLYENHDLDRVKVGIDDDGDAFVRTDSSVRVMDAQELKTEIDQVAAAADEVYGKIKPFLKTK